MVLFIHLDLVKPSRQFSSLCCSKSPPHNLFKKLNSTVFTLNSQQTWASTRQTKPKLDFWQLKQFKSVDKNVHFWNKRSTIGNKCVNRRRKEWKETTLCKSWPLCVRHPLHRPPPDFWICCPLTFIEQQTGQAPPAFSLLSHLPCLPPSHHWSWRTPALVSSPRGIVTYGNALRMREMTCSRSVHSLNP